MAVLFHLLGTADNDKELLLPIFSLHERSTYFQLSIFRQGYFFVGYPFPRGLSPIWKHLQHFFQFAFRFRFKGWINKCNPSQ